MSEGGKVHQLCASGETGVQEGAAVQVSLTSSPKAFATSCLSASSTLPFPILSRAEVPVLADVWIVSHNTGLSWRALQGSRLGFRRPGTFSSPPLRQLLSGEYKVTILLLLVSVGALLAMVHSEP